eukprot:SAG22_NODE_793_length_7164_cov_30.556043_2_plen_38_part_00
MVSVRDLCLLCYPVHTWEFSGTTYTEVEGNLILLDKC